MAEEQERILVGTLRITTDNYLVQLPDRFLDVDLRGDLPLELDGSLDRKPVSLLGHMGERDLGNGTKVPSFITRSIAGQEAIARRAFEMWASHPNVPALDNWLCAERQLLKM